MTFWEQKISDAFISRYFASAAEAEERRILRIRMSAFFPDFEAAAFAEKESCLEAAESLEKKGILKISWEKGGKGERPKILTCVNIEKLFHEAGKRYPKAIVEEIKCMLAEKTAETGMENCSALLGFFAHNFSIREIAQGIDTRTMEDLIRLLEFHSHPGQTERISTRALSILLYRDSKWLEELLARCKPLFGRAGKAVPIPDLAHLERSYPYAMISGKIILEYRGGKTPLVNATGRILGLPLENAAEISSIALVSPETQKTVLTIENKETFYALGTAQRRHSLNEPAAANSFSAYGCFLYIGGYSNRAAAALVKVLSASGFSFYHAGDLDPDGILILQHIQELARTAVRPLRMDAATFDQYRAWARSLTKPMLYHIKKITEETRAIPGLAELIQRIEETGLGIEQEIIDYRC